MYHKFSVALFCIYTRTFLFTLSFYFNVFNVSGLDISIFISIDMK
jgi:hypothetical protein